MFYFHCLYLSLVIDIEARIKEIQARKKELSSEENGVAEKSRIGLGESGYFDQEIYDGGGGKFDGYVTSIAANDEVDVSTSFKLIYKIFFTNFESAKVLLNYF